MDKLFGIGIMAFCLLCCNLMAATSAFPVAPRTISRATMGVLATRADLESGPQLHPPMSKEEILGLLDSVPLYAITEPDKKGLVLLKEKNNPNDIAYFFFSPETANVVYAPLRQKNEDASWDVTQYPLGLVWFELVKKPEPGIEYRLIPDGRDLGGARTLLEQQSGQTGLPLPEIFQSSYNEIPVFIDQFLRIQAADGDEKFPMYLGLQDMIMTCKQATDASSGQYEAALNVANLSTLIDQMQVESENDFRKAVLVPPSPQLPSEIIEAPKIDSEDDEPISTPTATESWED